MSSAKGCCVASVINSCTTPQRYLFFYRVLILRNPPRDEPVVDLLIQVQQSLFDQSQRRCG